MARYDELQEFEVAEFVGYGLGLGFFPSQIVRKGVEKGFPKYLLLEIIEDMRETKRKMDHCEKIGHSFEASSFANEDTGWEAYHCKRCGFYNEVTFY